MKLFASYKYGVVLLLTTAISMSKSDGATSDPLPPLQTILQRVMQTSADENAEYHRFNQHYYYTRDKVTEFYDKAGKVTERHEKQSTNNPDPVSAVLSIPRPQPEQPAVRAVPSGKEAQKVDPNSDPNSDPNLRGVKLGKKEQLLNPDIIKRFKLTIVGRDTINGRPALIIDFEPVSDSLPVFNIKDRFINSIEGRAWVDEKDFTLEKVYLHLRQKVTVLGGIAGSVSNFSLSFDRERTPDGFWFTKDLDWHVEAREAMLHRDVNHYEEIIGVQKVR